MSGYFCTISVLPKNFVPNCENYYFTEELVVGTKFVRFLQVLRRNAGTKKIQPYTISTDDNYKELVRRFCVRFQGFIS